MRTELNMDDVSKVAGGNAYINGNTMKMCFDSFDTVYKMKASVDQIRGLCVANIGKYATVEEYDTACRNQLLAKGWIE